jgi:hypothetical protein
MEPNEICGELARFSDHVESRIVESAQLAVCPH